jgi:beta-glucosidase
LSLALLADPVNPAENEAGMTKRFPDGFIWGTATAAHQVEGGNTNSDNWLMEMAPNSVFAEPSGDACDHYHRYESDIALLAQLGFRAYRFSIEWARIEPEEGFFSKAALDHYRRVAACCLANGIVPVVTFHHFTNPLWMAKDGGWEDAKCVDRFARYCERASRALGDLIGFACTINEANIPMMATHFRELATGKPWRRSRRMDELARNIGADPARFAPYMLGDAYAASKNLIAAHRKAYETIKAAGVTAPVGLTLALQDFHIEPGGEESGAKAEHLINGQFLESLKGDDFVGVQSYSRQRIGPNGLLPPPDSAERTQMGYEFWPEALEATIRNAAKVSGCPVLVTENGIGTEDDTRRLVYTRRALEGVLRCLADGIDVRAYIHWSMMDNFEWTEGYRPKFGLIAVDRATQLRTPKPSAYWLGKVAQANALD